MEKKRELKQKEDTKKEKMFIETLQKKNETGQTLANSSSLTQSNGNPISNEVILDETFLNANAVQVPFFYSVVKKIYFFFYNFFNIVNLFKDISNTVESKIKDNHYIVINFCLLPLFPSKHFFS